MRKDFTAFVAVVMRAASGESPRSKAAVLIASLALAVAGCSRFRVFQPEPAQVPAFFQGVSAVQITKLQNGLTVLIRESHANPIVTLDVWVNTGSMNEPPEINGVSHFLEHMLFKGTAKRPAGKLDLDVESVGGETNAGTSKDFTHYYVTVASDYITTGLDVLSDILMNSTLDPVELERERQVILEEYRRKQDSPFSLLFDLISEAAYRSGPNRQSVLGTTETISTITRAQIRDYYQRYYTPDNTALVAVGDFDTRKVLPLIQKYFGRYRRTVQPYDHLDMETRWAPASTQVIQKDVRDTYAVMAFPAPGLARPRDTIVMDLILGVLGEGRSSRLYQTLREKKKLVSSIGAAYGTPKKPGLFVVFATLDFRNLEAARDATLAEIRRIRDRNVGRRELAKVKKMCVNDYYFANETTNGQSETLGLYYTLSGSEKFEKNYLREIAGVTAGDIRRVARQYLDPEKLYMITIRPKGEGETGGGGM